MCVWGEDGEIYVSRLKCWEIPRKWAETLHAGAGPVDSAPSPLYAEREPRAGFEFLGCHESREPACRRVPAGSWAGIVKG